MIILLLIMTLWMLNLGNWLKYQIEAGTLVERMSRHLAMISTIAMWLPRWPVTVFITKKF